MARTMTWPCLVLTDSGADGRQKRRRYTLYEENITAVRVLYYYYCWPLFVIYSCCYCYDFHEEKKARDGVTAMSIFYVDIYCDGDIFLFYLYGLLLIFYTMAVIWWPWHCCYRAAVTISAGLPYPTVTTVLQRDRIVDETQQCWCDFDVHCWPLL